MINSLVSAISSGSAPKSHRDILLLGFLPLDDSQQTALLNGRVTVGVKNRVEDRDGFLGRDVAAAFNIDVPGMGPSFCTM